MTFRILMDTFIFIPTVTGERFKHSQPAHSGVNFISAALTVLQLKSAIGSVCWMGGREKKKNYKSHPTVNYREIISSYTLTDISYYRIGSFVST